MSKKAIITVGMAFGDEGKGSCVDYLADEYKADLVVRYNGGHQAAHNVVLENGESHTFSQFGSASFSGIPTYLGPNTIVELNALIKESQHLEQLGVSDPLSLITIDPYALVTTPFHRILNHIKELGRKEKHGSCGLGIGETRSYWLNYGTEALFVKDFHANRQERLAKLELLRQRTLLDAQQHSNSNETNSLLLMLADFDVGKWDDSIKYVPRLATIESFSSAKTIVFEGAQGVLLDEYFGFHPYTTWSNTTTKHALDLCSRLEITDIETIGIVRSYFTRHGNGPMPTETKNVLARGVEHNNWGPWQGYFRFGYFDRPLFKYALSVQKVDSIFLTHEDNDPGQVCLEHEIDNESLAKMLPTMNLEKQRVAGEKLLKSRPKELVKASARDTIETSGSAKVKFRSFGPKRKDKERV